MKNQIEDHQQLQAGQDDHQPENRRGFRARQAHYHVQRAGHPAIQCRSNEAAKPNNGQLELAEHHLLFE